MSVSIRGTIDVEKIKAATEKYLKRVEKEKRHENA